MWSPFHIWVLQEQKSMLKMLPKQRSRRESSPNLVANSPVGILAEKLFIGHLGKTLFRYDITTAKAVEKAQKEEAKEKEKVEKT